MSVYVDKAQHPHGRMIMCHMLADTPAELHAMADRIGVARKWYQRNASTPHYDIAKCKRAAAVSYGAVEVDRRGMHEIIKRIREAILRETAVGKDWIADYRQSVVTQSGDPT